jgi:hypothetical protein
VPCRDGDACPSILVGREMVSGYMIGETHFHDAVMRNLFYVQDNLFRNSCNFEIFLVYHFHDFSKDVTGSN